MAYSISEFYFTNSFCWTELLLFVCSWEVELSILTWACPVEAWCALPHSYVVWNRKSSTSKYFNAFIQIVFDCMQHMPFVLNKNCVVWNLVKEFTDKWQIWSLKDVHVICIIAQKENWQPNILLPTSAWSSALTFAQVSSKNRSHLSLTLYFNIIKD
jgi:hypothetical protein